MPERIPLTLKDVPVSYSAPQDGDTTIVMVDCETMGLDIRDGIIELCMARCRYDSAGRLAGIEEALDAFQDPGKPIPGEITRLTGITDDMVRGRKIDGDAVRHIMRGDPYMVAHNAAFDRPRFERLFPNDMRWGCTMACIPWLDMGHRSRKLGSILRREGWVFDAHRASADCLAAAWLLHVVPGALRHVAGPTVMVAAEGVPPAANLTLKRRGYWWNPARKHWWVLRPDTDGAAEAERLGGLYPGDNKAHIYPWDQRAAFRT